MNNKLISKAIDICFYLLLVVAISGVLYEVLNAFNITLLTLNSKDIYSLAVLIACISPIVINIIFFIEAIKARKKKDALFSMALLILIAVAIIKNLGFL